MNDRNATNETLTEMQTRILKGTLEYLENSGTAGFKMEEIARYIGVSKKTVYNHFPNKRRLLEASIDARIGEIDTGLDSIAAEPNVDFIAKLKRLLSFIFSEIARSQGIVLLEASNFPGDLQDRVKRFITGKTVELTRSLVEEGIERGMLRSDLHKEMLPYFCMKVMESTLDLTNHEDIGMRREELLAASIRITLEGILSPTGRERFGEGE
jgi:TetR/AcrR family transcriptional regulator, cholesterol catabolism regulator